MAKLLRFVALPWGEKSRAVEAAFYLLAVRLVFRLLPLQRALKLFGIVRSESGPGRISAAEAELVSRAVGRAAGQVPFRAVCLQQAFAAFLMLRRRGLAATVHLGLMRQDGSAGLQAHAWSLSGATPVTGVAAARGFTPIAAFAA